MKALALSIALLMVGDMVLDHGHGVLIVAHASGAFMQDFAQDFHDSLFAA